MKQRGQKLLCVHMADEGALCHRVGLVYTVHCAHAHLCLVKIGMCTLDGAPRGEASLSRLKSQPGPIDQTEQV